MDKKRDREKLVVEVVAYIHELSKAACFNFLDCNSIYAMIEKAAEKQQHDVIKMYHLSHNLIMLIEVPIYHASREQNLTFFKTLECIVRETLSVPNVDQNETMVLLTEQLSQEDRREQFVYTVINTFFRFTAEVMIPYGF